MYVCVCSARCGGAEAADIPKYDFHTNVCADHHEGMHRQAKRYSPSVSHVFAQISLPWQQLHTKKEKCFPIQ